MAVRLERVIDFLVLTIFAGSIFITSGKFIDSEITPKLYFTLSGYNYLRLYKYAEEISAALSQNRRVNDLIIENVQGKEVEEMYLDFDRHRIALYQFNVGTGYRALQELLTERNLGRFTSDFITGDLVLKSSQMDRFDVWHLLNSYVKAGDRSFPLSAFGQIGQRTAKNSIPKKKPGIHLDGFFQLYRFV